MGEQVEGLVDEPDGRSEFAPTPARRHRPWLGIACAVLLVACGVAWWWHATDPFNPYRDGTTHAATLSYTQPPCLNSWGTSLDGGTYLYRIKGDIPADYGQGPVTGEVRIVHQRSQTEGEVAARFTGGGHSVDLYGGKEPVLFELVCAVR